MSVYCWEIVSLQSEMSWHGNLRSLPFILSSHINCRVSMVPLFKMALLIFFCQACRGSLYWNEPLVMGWTDGWMDCYGWKVDGRWKIEESQKSANGSTARLNALAVLAESLLFSLIDTFIQRVQGPRDYTMAPTMRARIQVLRVPTVPGHESQEITELPSKREPGWPPPPGAWPRPQRRESSRRT